MVTRFDGLTAAPFTPFNADRTVNLEVIPAYAQLLRRSGVKAVFVCGTTGESASLTTVERQRVAERWVNDAGPDLKVIVHVGHTTVEDAGILAGHAARIGAAAIAALAPYFFKPRDPAELMAWCGTVASFAPQLPFYYYHIPSMTGVSLPVAEFLACAENRIPSLAGVKYTHDDLADFTACHRFGGGRYDVLFGRDELLLESLVAGATGAVGSTYNYAAPLYLRIMAAHQSGDLTLARQLQDKAIRMIAICNGIGVTHLAASKAIMATLGVDCGPVRPPLAQPNVGQVARLRAELEAMGFAEFSPPRA